MKSTDHVALGVRDELRVALGSFVKQDVHRPGATVQIDVRSPLGAGIDLQRALRQEAVDMLQRAGRAWTPDFKFSLAQQVSIEVNFATALVSQTPGMVPHISLEFPEDHSLQGLVRSRLDDSIVYSLMREAPSEPSAESRPLLLGSQHFPADVFLQIRRDGEEISVRAPHSRYQVRVVTLGDVAFARTEPMDLSNEWQPLVSVAQADRASGRFEITKDTETPSGSPMHLDYNILGWGLEWNRKRQTRFPGVTTGEVIVTRREAPRAGLKTPSFIKTYECYTVDDAASLEQYFRCQQHEIRAINRAAGTSALEEVEVWRGAPLRVTDTVTYYGVIPTADTSAGTSSKPQLQPDHRVFVSRPSLPAADWEDAQLSNLEYLAPLAHTLDIAHRQGAAHCDVKPENVRFRQQFERQDAAVAKMWVVLIDSESFTKPNGPIRYTGLHTPRYTHPSFDPTALSDPSLGQLVANDRLGFVAITIAALFGLQVCKGVFTDPPPSQSWRREVLLEAIAHQLPHAPADDLVELLMAPLEADSEMLAESVTSWSCSDWLTAVAEATTSRAEHTAQSPEHPARVKQAMDSIRQAFDNAARPNKKAAVEEELARQTGLLFWQGLVQGLVISSLVSILLAIVLVVILTQGGAS